MSNQTEARRGKQNILVRTCRQFVLLALTFSTHPAFSSCPAPPSNAKKALASFGTAILGKVVSTRQIESNKWVAEIEAHRIWGKHHEMIQTSIVLEDGFNQHFSHRHPRDRFLTEGKEYLVYAIKQNGGQYSIGACGSRILARAKAGGDLKFLGKPQWTAPLKRHAEANLLTPLPSPSLTPSSDQSKGDRDP